MTEILLVAERFNLPRVIRFESHASTDMGKWIEISLRLGCFRNGPSAQRLMSIGCRWDRALNLLPPAPQRVPFDAALAKRVATTIKSRYCDGTKIIMAGRRVATAFGFAKWPMLHATGGMMLVPHPSGLNHWWNDEIEVEIAEDHIRSFLG